MSIKYEVDCPYCGVEQCLRTDDDESDRHLDMRTEQHTCIACSLKFTYKPKRIIYYVTRRADCLNGAAHDWIKSCSVVTYNAASMICFACGTVRGLTQEEKSKHE